MGSINDLTSSVRPLHFVPNAVSCVHHTSRGRSRRYMSSRQQPLPALHRDSSRMNSVHRTTRARVAWGCAPRTVQFWRTWDALAQIPTTSPVVCTKQILESQGPSAKPDKTGGPCKRLGSSDVQARQETDAWRA